MKTSANTCVDATKWEVSAHYGLYALGVLAHYYWFSFVIFAWIVSRMRLKRFSKSSAILGMLYIVELRLFQPVDIMCCSSLYFVTVGIQTANFLPAFFLMILGARVFRDKSFIKSLDYAHSGQVAAFFQLFPSYALSLFDLFDHNLALATFASLVLITTVTFGNYRSFLFIWLRKLLGRYSLVIGSLGLNLTFLYFDSTSRGMTRAGCDAVARELWSCVASYEVECIYLEKQLLRRLRYGEPCLDLLEESASHKALIWPPKCVRAAFQTRLFRLLWKNSEKLQEQEMTKCIAVPLANGAVVRDKTKSVMLSKLLSSPSVDLFLVINGCEPNYHLRMQGTLTFLDLCREKAKSENQAAKSIYQFLRRREENIVFLIWMYERKALHGVQRLSFSLVREMTNYIA